MNKEILIDISPNGAMHGLHFDEFPLQGFGKAEVTRATDIKWRTEEGCWDIILLEKNGTHIHHFPKHLRGFFTYEAARKHEVAYLQACRLEGIGTVSNAGDELGTRLRG